MHDPARPSPVRRRCVLLVAATVLSSSFPVFAGPTLAATAPVLRHTFTGAPGFPELGGPGGVLSIDATTSSARGGTNTYTPLDDLVIEETSPNQIAWLAEDSTAFSGSLFGVEAPSPFAWEPGSGRVSVTRADDPATPCGSLGADLSVTQSLITVTFTRTDAINRCVLRLSGIKVVPTAAAPLVSQALLLTSGSAPGIPGLVGVLALTSTAGSSPTIRLSSSPTTTTCCAATRLVGAFAADGANREVRLEQSLDTVNWTAAGTFTTDATGRATIGLQPRFNRYYRLAFVGGPRLAAGVSNVVRVLVRLKATQSPVDATTVVIRRGTTITFTTTVTPVVPYFAVPKVEFRLYHRSVPYGPWSLSTTRVIAARQVPPPVGASPSNGRATWRLTFAGHGEWYVRSRALSTDANASSTFSPIARFWVP